MTMKNKNEFNMISEWLEKEKKKEARVRPITHTQSFTAALEPAGEQKFVGKAGFLDFKPAYSRSYSGSDSGSKDYQKYMVMSGKPRSKEYKEGEWSYEPPSYEAPCERKKYEDNVRQDSQSFV